MDVSVLDVSPPFPILLGDFLFQHFRLPSPTMNIVVDYDANKVELVHTGSSRSHKDVFLRLGDYVSSPNSFSNPTLTLSSLQSRSTSMVILQRARSETDPIRRRDLQYRMLRDFIPPFYLLEGVCSSVACKNIS